MGIHEKMQRLEIVRHQAEMGIVSFCIGLIIFFCGMGFFQSTASMVIGLIVIALGVLLFKGTHEQYKKTYKDLFAEEQLNKNFENVYYAPRSGFDLETVNDFQLCARGNKATSEDYIKATYNGINFEMSDVTLENTNKDHRSGENILFMGRIIKFEFKGKYVSPVRVYSKLFYYRSKKHATAEHKIEMESIDFNETFDVYTENEHDAYYLLTPLFMEQLKKLQKKYQNISIMIFGNTAIACLNEKHTNDSFDKNNWLEKVTYPEEIEKVQSDIDDLKTIMDVVNSVI